MGNRRVDDYKKVIVGQYLQFKNRTSEMNLIQGDGSIRSVLSRYVATSQAEVLTADRVLTQKDQNGTFYLNLAAGFDVTLPAPYLGGQFEFIVKLAPTTNGYDIKTNGGADILIGLGYESEVDTSDDGPTDQNADNLNLAANIAVAGDFVRVKCDGTNWYWESGTAADGGVVPSTT